MNTGDEKSAGSIKNLAGKALAVESSLIRQVIWTALMLCLFNLPAYAGADTLIKVGNNVIVKKGQEAASVVSIMGDVLVEGSVRDDVVAVGGSIFLGPGSTVSGDVVSVGGTVTKHDGSQVHGDVTVLDISRAISFFSPSQGHWWDVPHGYTSWFGVFPFIGFLALALILVAIAPKTIGHISFVIENAAVKSFFLGILGCTSLFPVAFMLFISIIGIILIPFEMLLAAVAFFIGYVAIAQLIGKKICLALLLSDKPILLETLVGAVFVWLVSLAPFLGSLFSTGIMITGFGGVISATIQRARTHSAVSGKISGADLQ